MAFYCQDCKILYASNRSNCPYCGGSITRDQQLEGSLLRCGYHRANLPSPSGKHYSTTPPENLVQAATVQEQVQKPEPRWGNHPNPFVFQRPQADLDTAASNSLFIGQDEPLQPEATSANAAEQMLNQERRRLRRAIRWSSTMDMFSSIPWGSIGRLLPVILVIALIALIWSFRYVILSFITEAIFALVPVVIVLIGIWYIIRSIFR